jgi:hypothetical protein
MKRLLLRFLLLTAATSLLFITSCDDDEAAPQELLPKLDGLYIYGSNTIAATSTEPAARMDRAILDHGKAPNVEDQEGVYGKFLYIGANSTIKFVHVVDEVGTVLGAQDGGTVSNGLDVGNVPIDDMVIHGTLEADADEIAVAEEGLYYAFVNINTGFFLISRVEPDMIGDATPGQWATGTDLPLKSVSKDSAVFEITGLTLHGESGYRYRLNEGWHFYQEENVLTTLSSLGVLSYGESWPLPANDIGFFLDNAPHQQNGVYTVKLKYDAATEQWSEKKTRTGNILIDYSSHNMAIIGDATADGSFNGDGTGGYQAHNPVKAGNVYTWTWNDVALIQDKEFIFLEDATWGGLQIDFAGASVGGDAVTSSKIIDATTAPVNGPYHNFHVMTGGTYDITLVINAETDARTITITTN